MQFHIRWCLWLRLWCDPKMSLNLEWVFSVGLFFGFKFLLIVNVISDSIYIDKLSMFWNSISTVYILHCTKCHFTDWFTKIFVTHHVFFEEYLNYTEQLLIQYLLTCCYLITETVRTMDYNLINDKQCRWPCSDN